MTKAQFYAAYVKPYLKTKDRPFNRQLFNDQKDNCYRSGLITEKQCFDWIYPQTKLFV